MTLVANEATIVRLHFYVNIREIDHVLCRRKKLVVFYADIFCWRKKLLMLNTLNSKQSVSFIVFHVHCDFAANE